MQPLPNFNNTEIAFASKSNKKLRASQFLFKIMGVAALVKIGTRITPWAIKVGLPIKGLLRKTIFAQFVGGESLEETTTVVTALTKYKVQVILDYGVEGGDYNEAELDTACNAFIQVIQYAATQNNIPYISIKVTGLANFALLQRIDTLMHNSLEKTLIKRYNEALDTITAAELSAWQQTIQRLTLLCETAQTCSVGILVDAEETWIQDPIDAITMLLMDTYNKKQPILYNTVQLYRQDRLKFLRQSYEAAQERNFILGVKIVRGAYMEKEAKNAEKNNYPNPIQPTKEACDADYNAAIRLCMQGLQHIAVIVATHNESSNMLAVAEMQQLKISNNHNHIHFSQLYGMSDNITYNLANYGCNVSKYLPFGPIADVIPYLMRRAQENSSVSGQTGRELALINKELKRRK